jgi:hypothetical protein
MGSGVGPLAAGRSPSGNAWRGAPVQRPALGLQWLRTGPAEPPVRKVVSASRFSPRLAAQGPCPASSTSCSSETRASTASSSQTCATRRRWSASTRGSCPMTRYRSLSKQQGLGERLGSDPVRSGPVGNLWFAGWVTAWQGWKKGDGLRRSGLGGTGAVRRRARAPHFACSQRPSPARLANP